MTIEKALYNFVVALKIKELYASYTRLVPEHFRTFFKWLKMAKNSS